MSLFHIYTVGKAASNKKLNSPQLEIYPIEKLGYVDGEITDAITEDEIEGTDAHGKKYRIKGTVGNSIEATWIPFGSNRTTAPDIRRGERVLIWRYGDSDMYYWGDCGLDAYLRRLETVIYCFSNTRDESVKTLTPENSWYIEVSTHRKMITLQTNKSDGERVAYTMQFNITKGTVVLTDDLGNHFEIDSFNKILTLQNADGSVLQLDKMKLYGYAKESIVFKTKAYSLDCATATVTATTSIAYKSPTYNLKANYTGAGTFEQTGAGTWTGAFSTTGAMKNNNINIGSTHTHAYTDDGAGMNTAVPH